MWESSRWQKCIHYSTLFTLITIFSSSSSPSSSSPLSSSSPTLPSHFANLYLWIYIFCYDNYFIFSFNIFLLPENSDVSKTGPGRITGPEKSPQNMYGRFSFELCYYCSVTHDVFWCILHVWSIDLFSCLRGSCTTRRSAFSRSLTGQLVLQKSVANGNNNLNKG